VIALTGLSTRPITTTDALKLVGVLAFLVDHTGFFFDPGDPWWRLVGRIASPIFFFLVGFAHTRRVPWTWPVLGVLLTLSMAAVSGVWTLNILLNFALLRAVVLPLVERHVLPRPWAVAALAGLCLALISPTDNLLEYGTEGWLWALFGLSHRVSRDGGGQTAATSSALGILAAGTYILHEARDYAFDGIQAAILVVLVVALLITFLRFRRSDLPWQPGAPLAGIMRFCGRHSLEIYAFSLFAMELLAYAIARGWWR
jgi:peptidoglycan/LPS O-acetylase OafA/YrhL